MKASEAMMDIECLRIVKGGDPQMMVATPEGPDEVVAIRRADNGDILVYPRKVFEWDVVRNLRLSVKPGGRVTDQLPNPRELMGRVEEYMHRGGGAIGISAPRSDEMVLWWQRLVECLMLLFARGVLTKNALRWPDKNISLLWLDGTQISSSLSLDELFVVTEKP